MIICVAEDRPENEPGLQVLISSLSSTNSKTNVVLFCPKPTAAFRSWLKQFSQVELREQKVPGSYGWNVKPHALLTVLDEGHPEAIWLDSDIAVTGRLDAAFNDLDAECVVLTEEALWGQERDDEGAARARAWQLEVGRVLPFVANTCVMRVTTQHYSLLRRWKEILESDCYRRAQEKVFAARPTHMGSDQDVLTALLASREFSSVPIKFLRRGRDIIQYFGPLGFTLPERFRSLFTLPTFIHSQGPKPWAVKQATQSSSLKERIKERIYGLYADVSPFVVYATRLPIDFIGGRDCLKPRTRSGAVMMMIGLRSPALTGLPLAAFFELFALHRRFKRVLAKQQQKTLSF
jgi:hypothetical protein